MERTHQLTPSLRFLFSFSRKSRIETSANSNPKRETLVQSLITIAFFLTPVRPKESSSVLQFAGIHLFPHNLSARISTTHTTSTLFQHPIFRLSTKLLIAQVALFLDSFDPVRLYRSSPAVIHLRSRSCLTLKFSVAPTHQIWSARDDKATIVSLFDIPFVLDPILHLDLAR